MSLLATLEKDYEEVKAKVEAFATDKLSPALEDAKKLADNPVAAALLRAVHVPTEALDMAVQVIDKLEELYAPDTETAAPAAAEPDAQAVAETAAAADAPAEPTVVQVAAAEPPVAS